MHEVDNVLDIYRKARAAIDSNDTTELKHLSNRTIHTATLAQDSDNIVVAVLIYALGKIFERNHYKELEGWNEFEKVVKENLDGIIKSLEKGDIEKARVHEGKIRNSLNKMDTHLANYIKDIFQKAELNKAFKMYEHGLSAEQTAKLLGVSLWDLSSYIGQSSIGEAHVSESVPIKQRLKTAEEFFQ